MKAMIFAAGLGTRLKPLTDIMPKAMVPVGGRPLIQILMEKLVSQGFNDIVINVHHFSEQIIDFVNKNKSFGANVKFSDETNLLLETGGGIKNGMPLLCAEQKPETPILLHNVDILSNQDLGQFYSSIKDQRSMFHGELQPMSAALLVSGRKTSRYLLADDNDMLVGWTNINTGQVKSPYPELDVAKCHKYAFSGIHIFHPSLFPLMDSWTPPFGIIDFYLSICHQRPIKCIYNEGLKLLDVGKVETLEAAEAFLNS